MEMFWLYSSFPGNYSSIFQFSSAIAHKVVSLAPSLINRFDASRLVSVLIGCIGFCKQVDNQKYTELHACLKKAASQSSNDFGQLNNLMKPYIKIARLIKNELESKDGINFGFESVLSNVKRFKSFWFVFLPLFYKCCDYLNQYGCKSFVLLLVVSNKLSLISITELDLRQSVMRDKYFADIFKEIPKYSKAELFCIRTDGYQVQYIYKCNDDFQARTIEETRCIDALLIPAAGDDHQQVQENGVQADLAVLNYVFDLCEDDYGEQMLVVQGHNRNYLAVCSPVEDYQNFDFSQIPFKINYRFLLSQSYYMQLVGGQQLCQEYQYVLSRRVSFTELHYYRFCIPKMEVKMGFNQILLSLVFYQDPTSLKLRIDKYLYQQDAFLQYDEYVLILRAKLSYDYRVLENHLLISKLNCI
ncbi:hypothetical protein MIR68_007112 [Amoeboaphelidium protococcarum]|nr:hypothetical protein MIR68_007112 [Amoeboaphelidium protococcarum]